MLQNYQAGPGKHALVAVLRSSLADPLTSPMLSSPNPIHQSGSERNALSILGRFILLLPNRVLNLLLFRLPSWLPLPAVPSTAPPATTSTGTSTC